MSWLAIILGAVKVLSAIIGYLQQTQALNDAEALLLAQRLKDASDEISKVQSARKIVSDRITANPNSVRNNQPDDKPFDADASG